MTDERRTVSPSRVLGGSVGRPFYGDGAPHWREGRGQGRPSGLAAEAEREVDLLVKSLRREGHREETPLLGGVQDDLLSLAVRIESCSGRRPCLSGACPCCRRALKRQFVYATRYIIYPGGPETLMIGRVLWDEFFANNDWPMASSVAVVMVLLIVVPLALFNKYQAESTQGAGK